MLPLGRRFFRVATDASDPHAHKTCTQDIHTRHGYKISVQNNHTRHTYKTCYHSGAVSSASRQANPPFHRTLIHTRHAHKTCIQDMNTRYPYKTIMLPLVGLGDFVGVDFAGGRRFFRVATGESSVSSAAVDAILSFVAGFKSTDQFFHGSSS